MKQTCHFWCSIVFMLKPRVRVDEIVRSSFPLKQVNYFNSRFAPTWSHPTPQMVLPNPMFVADKRSHRCTNTFFSFFRNLWRSWQSFFLVEILWTHLEQFQQSRTKFEIGLPPPPNGKPTASVEILYTTLEKTLFKPTRQKGPSNTDFC